jgi:hypothetical protein
MKSLEGRTLPELTVASYFAVVAPAGFVFDVVPVMSCADFLAVPAFYKQQTEKSGQNEAQVGPPSVGLFPIEAASERTQKSIIIPSKCLRSWVTGKVRPVAKSGWPFCSHRGLFPAARAEIKKCSIEVYASRPINVAGTAKARAVPHPSRGNPTNSRHTIGMPKKTASRQKRCQNVHFFWNDNLTDFPLRPLP